MKKLVGLLFIALLALVQPASAQDMAGQWQGTLHGAQDLRLVLKISKVADGNLTGTLYSIDEVGAELPVSSMSLQNSMFTFSIARIGGTYKGTVSAGGKNIKGTWTQALDVPLDFEAAAGETAWAIPSPADTSSHKVQFVATNDNVKLEVLDWGGSGRPLIFLAGLGGTAHVFDHFAPQFIEKYHVYGITRRGYGASDKPEPTMVNYSADRLGDDVLAVMDALKIEKPILVGHSLGGEELSSVGSRFPDKVAGLVYLDAGFAYGFYAPGNVIPLGSNLTIDANDISRKVQQFNEMGATPQALAALDDLIRTNLPQFKTDLLATQKMVQQQQRNLSNATSPPPPETPQMKTANAILNGEEKYTDIKAPILAIFAAPKSISPKAPTAIRIIAQLQNTAEEAQAKKFQAGNPTARVVLIANSRHDVFNSNTSDVIREMNSFLDHLN